MAFGDVDITEGAGTPIAMDLISGRNFQRGKLASGQEGVSDAIGDDDMGSSLRALWVANRARSGEAEIASAGLTIASTNYSIGDVLGTGWALTSMVDANGGMGHLKGLRVLDKADVMSGITLYFARASITFGTDNAAPSVSDSDALKIFATLSLGFTDLGGCRIACMDTFKLPYVCDATTLYVYATTPVANNFFGAVGDLSLWYAREKD